VDYAAALTDTDRMLTLEQTWNMPMGTQLSTAVTAELVSNLVQEGFAQDSTALGINVFGGGEGTAKLGSEANVRCAKAISGDAAPGISANVSLTD
jgi:hypothetical protein